MTYIQAVRNFKEHFLPHAGTDKPAIRMAWCTYIDGLHRDKLITDKQANEWDHPKGLG